MYIPHTFHSVPVYYERSTTTVQERFIDAYCKRASMDNMLPNPQGMLSKEIPSSGHCFADSCKLKHGRWCDSVH